MTAPNQPDSEGINLELCKDCGGKGFTSKMGVGNCPIKTPCSRCEERKKKFEREQPERSDAHKRLIAYAMLGKIFTGLNKEPTHD